MNTILYDLHWESLLPLTYTRPVAEIRMGLFTLRQKWENYLQTTVSFKTEEYLSEKFPICIEHENLFINSNIIATEPLAHAVAQLKIGQGLFSDNDMFAVVLSREDATDFESVNWEKIEKIQWEESYKKLEFPEQIFLWNGDEIRKDVEFWTRGRVSVPLNEWNRVLGADNVFVEEGAEVCFATLNASQGPIYIGKNAKVMEGAILRGPLVLCENAQVKMGAKIYGDSTFGPHCKVGGEVNNAVLFGYSNKAHDGYLGNAVLGEWCNIGADTNNSNLKNDYTEVKIWDYVTERFRQTGEQFCGTIMADHSKIGINTMLNTGTVIGVSANIFGAGFPRQFIPSFSWGGAGGFKEYLPKKALQTANLVLQRRGLTANDMEERILKHIFEISSKYRNF